jgi:hypothetical protein
MYSYVGSDVHHIMLPLNKVKLKDSSAFEAIANNQFLNRNRRQSQFNLFDMLISIFLQFYDKGLFLTRWLKEKDTP